MTNFENRQKIVRPSWNEYFLNIAKVVSTRSCDAQTKHGCVIVDPNNHIIGTGYNSFPRGIKDDEMPNLRPDKYPYINHSEINAFSNCIVSPWIYPSGVTVFVTGRPCTNCFKFMMNSNVRAIMAEAGRGWNFSEEEEELFFFLLKTSKILYEEIETKNS